MLIVPPRNLGILVGGLLVLLTVLLDVFWVWQVLNWPLTFLTFVQSVLVLLSLAWLGLLGYWLYGLITLRYHLDRNRFFVRWGATWRVIPLPDIKRVEIGVRVASRLDYRGLWWPGYWLGRAEVLGVGQTLFYATLPAARHVLLVTPGLAYAISPSDPEAFIRQLEQRRDMGPTQSVEQSSHRPAFVSWAFWADWTARSLLVSGGLTAAALFGRLCWRYPALPERLALHFDAQGQIDRVGQRGELFVLPVIGLIVLVTNVVLGFLLYRRERVGSYLIWGSVVAVHVLLWLALGQLTR
jgi:hypothetical protein